MKNQLTYKEVISLYFEKFGDYPVITGSDYFESNEITEKLINAIDSGIEFPVEEVPDGALV